MKKNSLLSGASLLFAMFLVASCGSKTSVPAPTTNNPELIESEFSCRKAREAEEGAEVIVEGIVAQVTRDNSKKPDGFFLVDEFGSTYCYNKEIANYVMIGNKVRIKGTKTWYVLEEEKDFANKFGYKGSNQINATELLRDDEKIHEIPTNAIEKTTIKEIMDTPVSVDITTKVFRVPAYIKRDQQQGYVNYLINDFDGKTGSYVYTKANGADYDTPEELKQYDGHKVLMYLTAINAKSTATGCNWRFIPIQIIDSEYDFPMSKVADFALDYYVTNQFLPTYTSNPDLEVTTSVSNDIIPFENVAITYTSSNTNVAHFETSGDVTKFVTGDLGNTTITAYAKYMHNGKNIEASRTIDISVEEAPELETLTVKQAFESDINTEVVVKGIVAGSAVNQNGYYLVDSTGSIVVKTSENIGSLYSIGDEVIVKGTRAKHSKGNQSYLADCELLVNNRGNHDIPTDSFITGKTANDLYKITTEEDHSGEIYVVECHIFKEVTQYYTNYYVNDDPTNIEQKGIQLYASKSSQYAWLDEFVDKGTFKMNVALCSWSGGTKGCLISIEDSEGTVHYNELYFK
ncbi:MAG: hypothetical protein MJ248_00020 [Bacilli bacterium]|nr:hypothetical protein [Bacilli bacterium]